MNRGNVCNSHLINMYYGYVHWSCTCRWQQSIIIMYNVITRSIRSLRFWQNFIILKKILGSQRVQIIEVSDYWGRTAPALYVLKNLAGEADLHAVWKSLFKSTSTWHTPQLERQKSAKDKGRERASISSGFKNMKNKFPGSYITILLGTGQKPDLELSTCYE